MSDDNFDDGLVHGHHWATEKPATVTLPHATAITQMDEYDDGLVHSHDWASTGN